MTSVSAERWIDRPGRDVRACVLTRPYVFVSPFGGEPFVLLLVVCDPTVTPGERDVVGDQIVASGCRYVCAFGHECSKWDDLVDWSHLGLYDFDPPEAANVMTTWHERDTPTETVDFAFDCTDFGDHVFERYVVAFVGDDPSVRAEFETMVRARI